jgi:DNA-binding NtrC family response regulator
MNDPVRILSICDDDGLRTSRHLLLMNEGYETESVSSNTVRTVLDGRSFDIALICRSISSDRATAIAQELRRSYPEIHIIAFDTIESRPDSSDLDLQVSSGPQPLLEAIRELCAREAGSRKEWYEVSHQA